MDFPYYPRVYIYLVATIVTFKRGALYLFVALRVINVSGWLNVFYFSLYGDNE